MNPVEILASIWLFGEILRYIVGGVLLYILVGAAIGDWLYNKGHINYDGTTLGFFKAALSSYFILIYVLLFKRNKPK
jgi:hypothetical protein